MGTTKYKPAPMHTDIILESLKPQPPLISERFKDMVSERDEELRVIEENENSTGLTGDEIVFLYDVLMSELSVNSKPLISDLTVIAGEQRMLGAGIADVICDRIVEVPVEQKLPSLYLLDSIVKNIGREYVKYFSARLPEVFCEAYKQVHPNMHPEMRHLFGTWSTVFPLSVLQKIESGIQLGSSENHQSLGLPPLRASKSPRSGHGTHIYPKYLEAGRQFGHEISGSSFQPHRGVSPSKIYTQKNSTDYAELNSDDGDTDVSLTKSDLLASSSSRSGPAAMKFAPTFSGRIERPSPSYGAAHIRSSPPSLDEWRVDSSHGKGALPLESGNYYRTGGVLRNSNNRTVDWKSNLASGDSRNHVRHPAIRLNNGVDLDRTRALINAYGMDQRTEMTKHPNGEEVRLNGIPTMTWKNSEEEEFVWENMSSTLADHGRKDVVSSSLPPSGSFRNTAPLESHFRQYWPNRPQFPAANRSFTVDVPSSRNGLKNTIYGIRNGPTHFQGSSNPPESWKSAQNVNVSSTYQFYGTKGGNNPWIPFRGSGISQPSVEHNPSSTAYSPDLNTQNQGPPSGLNTQNQGPPSGSRGDSVSLEYIKPDQWIAPAPVSAGAWLSTRLHTDPMLQTYQPDRSIRGQLDNLSAKNLLVNQNIHSSSLSEHTTIFPPHSLPQDMRHHVAPVSFVGQPPLLAPKLQCGYAPGHMASVGTMFPYAQSPLPTRLNGLPLPLPRGFYGSSHIRPISQPSFGTPNPPPVGGGYGNLSNSLMAQGVTLLNQTPAKEDQDGLEFNPESLKMRHDSAISALYSDLPRQCTTCGLRFKLQEAHSSHMDWHVTKNRVTRNRKQKASRKWFVSVNMWLTGAEALGTDSVPNFLPIEDIVEKDDEESAVPADDDQKLCALCGEPFDDFYCDETDEWMYQGAVYMNAPSGSTTDVDRSRLGPIVHAKCRSDTGAISEDMKKSEREFTEEASQRKRMRT